MGENNVEKEKSTGLLKWDRGSICCEVLTVCMCASLIITAT